MRQSMSNHPSEADLALFAGGDCGPFRSYGIKRHLTRCGDCRDTLTSFSEVRSAVREHVAPEPDWNRMSGDMRANIRLGLAAGECVREEPVVKRWKPQLAMGMAGVVLLAGAGFFLRGLLPHSDQPSVHAASVLQSTGAGVEVRTDSGNSMMLLNHGDVVGNQTVTAQGAIRASYIDGNTGTVTITSVYVE